MSRVSAVLVAIRNLTVLNAAAVVIAVAVVFWPAITGHNVHIYPDFAATIHCVISTHFILPSWSKYHREEAEG